MNACCICGLDGVLKLQEAWYCRDHSAEGVLDMVQLVTMWSRPTYAQQVRAGVTQVLDDWNVKHGQTPEYWCSECEADRFSADECPHCGCDVYLKSELEDEDEDEDEDEEDEE